MEGVGRRLGSSGFLLDIGSSSLNGREHNVLFRNDGDERFTEVGFANAADRIEDGRGLAIFDYDGNGSLDLLLRNYRMPANLLRNRPGRNGWVRFDLEGTPSNRDAVGARLRLRTGEDWQTRVVTSGSGYLSSSSRRQHFGLGAAVKIDEVVIEWPSGERTVLKDLDANRPYQITEGAGIQTARAGGSPAVTE